MQEVDLSAKQPAWHKRLVNAFYVYLGRWGKVQFWRICLREVDLSLVHFPVLPEGFVFEVLDEAGMRALADSNVDVSREFVETSIAQGAPVWLCANIVRCWAIPGVRTVH